MSIIKDSFFNVLNLMKETIQQKKIFEFPIKKGESARILSGPGSGKTTTGLGMVQRKPRESFLYICFNAKSAQEAQERSQEMGLYNVQACTVHALASKKKRTFTIADKFTPKLHIKKFQQRLDITNLDAQKVINTIKAFCNSDGDTLNKNHVAVRRGDTNEDENALLQKTRILQLSRQAWEAMIDLNDPFEVSFDEYLKVYALEHNVLREFDNIILDEGQDSNGVTLGIMEDQRKNSKIWIIGDHAQSIYTWRGAVNGMSRFKTDHEFFLTESFRFGKEIANVANLLLKNFHEVGYEVVGKREKDHIGKIKLDEPHTLIARTNAKLLETAIQYSTEGKKVHFVGTRREDGYDPSIPYRFNDALDVWRLWKDKKEEVRNPYYKNFKDYGELKEIATGEVEGESETGDSIKGDKELERFCKLIEKYGSTLPVLLQKIKACCTSQEAADIVLTTAHRSKGLQWPHVRLEDDFSDLIVRDQVEDPETYEIIDGPPRLAIPGEDMEDDEVNLLYVSATRAEEILQINNQIRDLISYPELSPNFPCQTIIERSIEHYQSPSPKKRKVEGFQEKEAKSEKDAKIMLKVPFNEKESAKSISKMNGGRLEFRSLPKLWEWIHPKKEPLPQELQRYWLGNKKSNQQVQMF